MAVPSLDPPRRAVRRECVVELVINFRTAVLSGIFLVGALQGCAVSPAQQEAIRQAWEEKDAQRAEECRRAGRGFVAGGCGGGGGP